MQKQLTKSGLGVFQKHFQGRNELLSAWCKIPNYNDKMLVVKC